MTHWTSLYRLMTNWTSLFRLMTNWTSLFRLMTNWTSLFRLMTNWTSLYRLMTNWTSLFRLMTNWTSLFHMSLIFIFSAKTNVIKKRDHQNKNNQKQTKTTYGLYFQKLIKYFWLLHADYNVKNLTLPLAKPTSSSFSKEWAGFLFFSWY
jgi:hypothetical protein